MQVMIKNTSSMYKILCEMYLNMTNLLRTKNSPQGSHLPNVPSKTAFSLSKGKCGIN